MRYTEPIQLLAVPQIAEKLCLSESAVRKMCGPKGELRSYCTKIGGSIRITPQKLNDFIEAQQLSEV